MTDLTIRVGGRYRTRGGEEAEVDDYSPGLTYGFFGTVDRRRFCWDGNGRFWQTRPHSLDLVSEITEPTAGERLVRSAKEAAAIARGEAQPAAVHTYIVSGGFAERIRSGCPDTVGDEAFAMTVEGEAKPVDLPGEATSCNDPAFMVAGLTKREWFAGQAIRAGWGDGTAMTAEDAARLAFQLADAMIAEGSKGDE